MSEPFLGEIRMFAFNFSPVGWLLADGSLLPVAQNVALCAAEWPTAKGKDPASLTTSSVKRAGRRQ